MKGQSENKKNKEKNRGKEMNERKKEEEKKDKNLQTYERNKRKNNRSVPDGSGNLFFSNQLYNFYISEL